MLPAVGRGSLNLGLLEKSGEGTGATRRVSEGHRADPSLDGPGQTLGPCLDWGKFVRFRIFRTLPGTTRARGIRPGSVPKCEEGAWLGRRVCGAVAFMAPTSL